MDGVEAARHMRALAPVLVIYLSASIDARTVARALEGPAAAAQGQPT